MCFHIYSRISELRLYYEQLKVVNWHEKCYLNLDSCETPVELKGWSMILRQSWLESAASFWVNILNGTDETDHLLTFNMNTKTFSQPNPPLMYNFVDASSTAAVDVKRWLAKCCEEHDCEKDRQEGFLPARLLECNVNNFKLIERKLLDRIEGLRYVTLSYCWGPTPKHTILTVQNYESLTTTGIPISDLEPTFVDATRIVIELGLKYLWIDALCIIEDSHQQEDWLYHVDQMKDIYGSCVLNIAAAHADDASIGCFSTRPLGATIPVSVSAPVFVARDTPMLEDLPTVRVFPPQFDPLPPFKLNSRGWVYQERLMSPRTVHYDAHEVYRECHAMFASGAFPDGHAQLGYGQYSLLPDRPSFTWQPEGEMDSSKLDIIHWTKLASIYSKRRLSNKADRLVAFSAITSKLSDAYNKEYVAGVFVSHLPIALMWYIYDYQSEVTMNSSRDEIDNLGMAPSWSWGSVMTGICWDGYLTNHKEVLATVLSLHAESINAYKGRYDDTSYVLTLHGPVFTLQIDRVLTRESSPTDSSESKCEFITLQDSICHLGYATVDNGLSSSCEPVEERKYCVKRELYSYFWLPSDKHRVCWDDHSWKSLIFFILMRRYKPKTNGWITDESGQMTFSLSTHGDTSSEDLYGIALLPLTNEQDDAVEKRYVRVGTFHLDICSIDRESTADGLIQHSYDTVVIV